MRFTFSMSIETKRDCLLKIFQGTEWGKYASQYERAIYQMCCALSKEENVPLDEVYSSYAWEKAGHLMAALGKAQRKEIVQDIKGLVIDWESSVYKEVREQLAKDMGHLTTEIEVQEGDMECGRCHKKRCYFYQLQTRGGDEGYTNFVTCINCGNRWRF